MSKKVQFYYRNPCSICEEVKTFLEEHGVIVEARDLKKLPLSRAEMKDLFKYFDAKHFIDVTSAAYKKARLDMSLPPREELYALVEENPELLRHPIITSGRLMTIGAGRRQLIDMFQLKVSDNGSGARNEAGKAGENKR